MVNKELINPQNIVVVGGSNDTSKPGGRLLNNLLSSEFNGEVFVLNTTTDKVQGIDAFKKADELPDVDLAILSIPAKYCPEVVRVLALEKNTKAFIILSAGFGEAGEKGKALEEEIVSIVNKVDGCLIGPNCIGVLNKNFSGVFTLPVPKIDPFGCDLISSSGATAVFLMEAGIPLGLKFAGVYSVGNSAQTSVEDLLEYMDKTYNSETDSNVKLLYLETIKDPRRFLKHARSLIQKGVKIAAIKAGSTDAGSRAAASHTGALSSSDLVVRALFRKSGVVYCSSREELLSIASLFQYPELEGKNIAIITHAGGSAVMLTDTLVHGGLRVPRIEGDDAEKLLSFLHPGSSVDNPIDFLATGTAEQLGIIIDYCEHKFDHIDGMVVVFGSAGLFNVESAYNVLSVKMEICKKPIYPVLPSVVNAQKEIQRFLKKGHVNFPDEVVLGRALTAIHNCRPPENLPPTDYQLDTKAIRKIIDSAENGFLAVEQCTQLLDLIGVPRADEHIVTNLSELASLSKSLNFPVVMKVIGPVHKSESGGVRLNISSIAETEQAFVELMKIESAEAVLIQPMVYGKELFIGLKRENPFGHLIFCGLGGVFIEIFKDFSTELCPVSRQEVNSMIQRLKSYKIIEGYRGSDGVNQVRYAEMIERVSSLAKIAPEISEMDINPLIGTPEEVIAVDVRIKIDK